jgi:hypothetical protein
MVREALAHHSTVRRQRLAAKALVFEASVGPGVPTVLEEGGTADAADWFHLEDVASGAVPVSDVVTAALAMTGRR